MSGILASFEREDNRGNGCRTASISPSGLRTAIAQALGARIITPSSTA
jgi:hypothetical protein